jgi:hypothetical protein
VSEESQARSKRRRKRRRRRRERQETLRGRAAFHPKTYLNLKLYLNLQDSERQRRAMKRVRACMQLTQTVKIHS